MSRILFGQNGDRSLLHRSKGCDFPFFDRSASLAHATLSFLYHKSISWRLEVEPTTKRGSAPFAYSVSNPHRFYGCGMGGTYSELEGARHRQTINRVSFMIPYGSNLFRHRSVIYDLSLFFDLSFILSPSHANCVNRNSRSITVGPETKRSFL